jgi:hypothetical protein
MILQIRLSLKQLATIWTLEVFDLAVSVRVTVQITFAFKCFFTLSALEVPRCLVATLMMIS